jgi:hypothetical protein
MLIGVFKPTVNMDIKYYLFFGPLSQDGILKTSFIKGCRTNPVHKECFAELRENAEERQNE